MISRYLSWVRGLPGPAAWLVQGALFTIWIFFADLLFDHRSVIGSAILSLIGGAAWTAAMIVIFTLIAPVIRRRRTRSG